MRRALTKTLGALALAGLASCASEETAPVYPADCSGLSARDRILCGDARFWEALTRDYEVRESTLALITEILADAPEGVDDPALANLHFRHGALAMALVLEHGRADLVDLILPSFHEAVRIDPANPKFPPWIDGMDLVVAFARADEEGVAGVAERIDPNVALYPTGNILSITGTMSGLPLSTGLPQRAVEMLEAWSCDEDWCRHNTARAPFSQPGLRAHFADAYARIGDIENARMYFERALEAEGADEWPHRQFVVDALADLDGYVARYTEIGDDGSAVSLVYTNSERACQICHGAR